MIRFWSSAGVSVRVRRGFKSLASASGESQSMLPLGVSVARRKGMFMYACVCVCVCVCVCASTDSGKEGVWAVLGLSRGSEGGLSP